MHRSLAPIVAGHAHRLSEVLRRFLAEGASLSDDAHDDALRARQRMVLAFAAWVAPYDAVLTPPACGEAPGMETTGDPRFCTYWTLLGAPALVLPTGRGPDGLPLGLQVVGAPGDDRRLLSAAAWLEATLPRPVFRRRGLPGAEPDPTTRER
jgi:Asp-tRNA(Asn)/Glu-tRNA(Gln) amidotransferase A subunit family amidase